MLPRRISSGSVRLTVLVWLLAVSVNLGSSSELKVRVRLADGQIADEVLEADGEKDSISVEFKQGDGTLITFVADFKQVNRRHQCRVKFTLYFDCHFVTRNFLTCCIHFMLLNFIILLSFILNYI